jgi:predicted nucleic acid-binding protein
VSSDRAVLNASPIITLCKSGQEDLQPQLFTDIVLPGEVWEEVEALRDAGLWLSDKLIEQLKQQEGE